MNSSISASAIAAARRVAASPSERRARSASEASLVAMTERARLPTTVTPSSTKSAPTTATASPSALTSVRGSANSSPEKAAFSQPTKAKKQMSAVEATPARL